MAKLSDFTGKTFDPTAVPPAEGRGAFELIKQGEYPAIILAADIDSNKNGDGTVLKCKYQITDGEYRNRILFDDVTLKSEDPKQQHWGDLRLAEVMLSTVGHATDDTDDVVNKPLIIRVGIQAAKANPKQPGSFYPEKNRIYAVKPFRNPSAPAVAAQRPAPAVAAKQQTTVVQTAAPAPAAAAPVAGGGKPWLQRATANA